MTDRRTTSAVQPGDGHLDLVRRVVARVLRRGVGEIGYDDRLLDELGVDSISALQLILEIEAGLDADFDLDDLEQHHFATVRSLAGYVHTQVSGPPCS
ncbi:acyl carrier protein [Jidongwangia harbinensis]|uniref:acyl carrier protein n=1 Tax=Jidongwangia harbinensis TaxID=2878561 RepID=UPI001CDA210E|nr:acyl carrier protein [Jidongwangia harbinensis]MCA2211342.1 acyl carrier protein [Jidongwangia harbinensis]